MSLSAFDKCEYMVRCGRTSCKGCELTINSQYNTKNKSTMANKDNTIAGLIVIIVLMITIGFVYCGGIGCIL